MWDLSQLPSHEADDSHIDLPDDHGESLSRSSGKDTGP
jgi:hypothetical protein